MRKFLNFLVWLFKPDNKPQLCVYCKEPGHWTPGFPELWYHEICAHKAGLMGTDRNSDELIFGGLFGKRPK